jgi:hypothetical protein
MHDTAQVWVFDMHATPNNSQASKLDKREQASPMNHIKVVLQVWTYPILRPLRENKTIRSSEPENYCVSQWNNKSLIARW